MDLNGLNPDFCQKFEPFADKVHELKLKILPIKGYVSVFEQATLWRSGHNDNEIDVMINVLQEKQCHNMAALLANTVAVPGPLVTNTLPGCCWHNWGQALLFQLISEDHKMLPLDSKRYSEVAKLAKKNGFVSGLSFKENPIPNLIQLSEYSKPEDQFFLQEIDTHLQSLKEMGHGHK